MDAPFAKTNPKATTTKQSSMEDPDKSFKNIDDDEDRKSRTENLTDKAKSGTKSAMETAFNLGKTVAEGMEKSWGGVKETTEKVKDTVIGNTDEDHSSTNTGHVDKHVEDLRRKAGGYDQRSH